MSHCFLLTCSVSSSLRCSSFSIVPWTESSFAVKLSRSSCKTISSSFARFQASSASALAIFAASATACTSAYSCRSRSSSLLMPCESMPETVRWLSMSMIWRPKDALFSCSCLSFVMAPSNSSSSLRIRSSLLEDRSLVASTYRNCSSIASIFLCRDLTMSLSRSSARSAFSMRTRNVSSPFPGYRFFSRTSSISFLSSMCSSWIR
mmetsp:Transcript_2909/g.18254  ORF Transcript_2909/g.18254 Transcript_2909/m.18254 type:complete len:206 (+) Transcript_2909:1157-1774(+)